MMTSRATIGVTAINTRAACTNQGFITCVPNERLDVYQIYYWLAENKSKLIALASGATFKEINRSTFRQLPIAVPDTGLVSAFAQQLEPIGTQLENLLSKNQILRHTRDLLLPQLFSGQSVVPWIRETSLAEGG
jgi:type I restriction enzyme S subunit